MKIGGIGYVPNHVKWIVECIRENISQAQENFIDIWNDGDIIIFSVSSTGMKFELKIFIKKQMVLFSDISPGKEIFRTKDISFHLTKKGLEEALKETIKQMKLEVTKELDSILKVKK